jgi:arylsulfatase A-like enzyme
MASVLIAVFDGLQPAQVIPELMPNLASLAAQGITFTNHHPVYPSVTRVNVSSVVTGRYPGGHGLAGNSLMVREFDATNVIPALETQLAEVEAKTGQVLLAPTLGEILSQNGQEYVAIGVGTSGNAYLQNPTAERSGGATIHPEFTLPHGLHEDITARFGPWPDETRPNTPRMAQAVKIITEYILPERNPAVALIWSSEPDKSQHDEPVGSDLSNAAIKEADQQFGILMDWLSESGRAADTNVMVVSDHGYSSIIHPIKVEALVREAGFPPCGEPGGVAVANNGGSALFYTTDGDPETAERLAIWLMGQEWCGSLTVSDSIGEMTGTFPSSVVGNQGPRGPEITMSFRWNSATNDGGYQGKVYSTSGRAGQGQHGSMSKHEMNNVMFAWGPGFKRGVSVDVPSGNIDVAPTILNLLGLPGGEAMDGRVLAEALVGGPDPDSVEWSSELHSTERRLKEKVYRQQIKLSVVGETTYVDEGNSTLGWR